MKSVTLSIPNTIKRSYACSNHVNNHKKRQFDNCKHFRSRGNSSLLISGEISLTKSSREAFPLNEKTLPKSRLPKENSSGCINIVCSTKKIYRKFNNISFFDTTEITGFWYKYLEYVIITDSFVVLINSFFFTNK